MSSEPAYFLSDDARANSELFAEFANASLAMLAMKSSEFPSSELYFMEAEKRRNRVGHARLALMELADKLHAERQRRGTVDA